MIIVVGVDGSPQSSRALRTAGRIAEGLEASLRVVYCEYLSPFMLSALDAVPVVLDDTVSQQRSSVWEAADEVIGEMAVADVEKVDLSGYPPDALVAYAESEDAELIVVGNRGYGPVFSALLGSTSHRVLNTASCDVLVVKGTK
ncbi:MAG: universal stress protein [Acidimicrobiia bacterium]|nr:universal stress protein [Acidimicrobiia bacterium]NNF63904.1 universal stress protein [Acidimicrobiia bacterium]